MTPEFPTNNDSLIATELVFINSSPINLAGLPKPRVLKRKDNKYMLPRSPSSPTLNIGGKTGTCTSGKHITRAKKDYVPTNVTELEVDPFQLCHTLWGRSVPSARDIELTKAPLFDPFKHYTTSFSQLHSLDMLPAKGLAESDFWKLFSKCKSCHHLMTTRTIPYHICPVSGTEPDARLRTTLNNVLQNKAHFIWLLDAHNSDHAAGVPENIFRSIFYLCGQCGRYMTQRVWRNHHEDADFDDYIGCINLRPARDLEAVVGILGNAEKTGFRTITQEFPVLLPLSQ